MKPWDMALKEADPELYRQLSGGKLWRKDSAA